MAKKVKNCKNSKHGKNYFLIDFENVNNSGLDGLELLDENDIVVIFYSDVVSALSKGSIKRLWNCRAKIVYEKVVPVGKNALDFQLSSYAGYLARSEKVKNCYIISKDKGYANVQSFWKDKGFDIILVNNIANVRNEYASIVASGSKAEESSTVDSNKGADIVNTKALLSVLTTALVSTKDMHFVEAILRDCSLNNMISRNTVKTKVSQLMRRRFKTSEIKAIRNVWYSVFDGINK